MAIEEREVIPQVQNPFAGSLVPTGDISQGTVAIESERAIAEVKAAMTIAKAMPRDKHAAMEKILETCRRTDFAKTAIYSYRRGGSVEGLTIRAAEVILNAWGNAIAELLELSQADGESEWMARAWDLETNTQYRRSFRFKHERHTGTGVTKLTDPRDIYELGANYGQRRLRALILELVDNDVVVAAIQQVRATLLASVSGSNKKTLGEKMTALVAEFGKIGVRVKLIESKIGRPISDALPEDWTDLATIYNALKEGAGAISDFFDVPRTTTASEAAKQLDDALATNSQPADNIEDSIRAELVAKCESTLNSKYKSAALRDTFMKNQLGDVTIDSASVDQLNALLDAMKQNGVGEESFEAATTSD